jgi:hypothetical protein
LPGREKRKRSRKQRARRGGVAAPPAEENAPVVHKSKDDLAREELLPLAEGERPPAVTVGAIVAALLGLSNIVGLIAGIKVGGDKPQANAVLLPTVLMFVAAAGMWQARYWAVLGFQTILAFLIVLLSVVLVKAETVIQVVLLGIVIAAAGTMFWFLVKSLARIQMPSSRG